MPIDQNLINQSKKKSRIAQRELYDALLPYLAAVCKRYLINQSDVQDALQESFINIFKNIEGYDAEKAAFRTWAVRITINSALRYNDRMYKMNTVEYVPFIHEEGTAPEVFSKMESEAMLDFVKQMPADLFVVFNMVVVDGFSHQEVAKTIDITSDLSRQRLSRARKWIDERTVGRSAETLKSERRG